MAKRVLTAEYLSINGVDRSSYTKKAELTLNSSAQETTTYGDGGWETFLGGLKSAELSWDYLNDLADANLDDTMFALFGTVVAFEIRGDNAVVGVNNPKYTGSILIDKWVPVGGSIGDVNGAGVSYKTSGAVARAEA